MKKILIIGANGQLGRKIKDFSNNDIFQEKIKFIFTDIEELDITNSVALENFLKANNFDFIVNCAAYTNVDAAENNYDNAKILNADAPSFLAKYSKKYNSKFIHISTDYVFDGTQNIPYNEENIPNPTSVYGATKLMGEHNVMSENIDSIIIRTSWLYSEYGKNFVKTMLQLAKEKDKIKVVYDQIGTPTYAGSLARDILNIINSQIVLNNWKSGIYHYSDLGVCSWFDLATKVIEKYYGLKNVVIPILSSEFKTITKRPNYSVLDKSKIMKTFNLSLDYWETALEKMLKE